MIDLSFKKIKILIFSIIIFFVFIFAFSLFLGNIKGGIDKTQWGLGNFSQGKQPIGNADRETLQKYNAYYVGNENEKTIYLTFDAGYENGYTNAILDTLKEEKVPAAFFLVGNYIEKNQDLVKRMVNEGHIVANHTYSHKDLRYLSDEEIKKEILNLEELYKKTTGENMKKYLRPPNGNFNEHSLSVTKSLGYKTIFWSLAYFDWNNNEQKSFSQIYEKILPRMHNGCVLLLHSTSKTNSLILKDLIIKLKKEGYSFKSLDDLTK